MALVMCRECATEVSSRAKKCPHCGVSEPARSTMENAAYIAAFIILVAGLSTALCSSQSNKTGTDNRSDAERLGRSGDNSKAVDDRMGYKTKAAALTKLVERCGSIAASHNACDDDIYKPVWRRFESSVGEVVKVDVKSIAPMNGGGAIAWTYQYVPGTYFDPSHLIRYFFTCRGQYSVLEANAQMMDAPPRSVIGEIAAYVCSTAEANRAVRLRSHYSNNLRMDHADRPI